MRDIETLDQIGSTGTYAPIRTSKLQKKPEFRGSILSGLMDFAYSVPDFRRSNKGNLRHRLSDVITIGFWFVLQPYPRSYALYEVSVR